MKKELVKLTLYGIEKEAILLEKYYKAKKKTRINKQNIEIIIVKKEGKNMENNKQEFINNIEKFFNNKDKGILVTGTHQYEKHKLIMAIIDRNFKNAKVLFRTNSMYNIQNREFVGWTGLKKKTIKSGEKVKIGRNFYEFDTFNTTNTWNRTSSNFDFAIVYPIDSMIRENKFDGIDNLYTNKDIKKIFLVSWTDRKSYDYEEISKYYNEHIIYDAKEEDEEYHRRVLNIINE